MRPEDWGAVRAIYLEGIASGNATFEQSAPDWPDWNQGHLKCCRLVARLENEIVGWTALSPVSRRSVYAGVAEFSIYVAERAQRRGIGSTLLQALIDAAEREGIWMLQSPEFSLRIWPAWSCAGVLDSAWWERGRESAASMGAGVTWCC
jgi:phosphinothricin acetyltransferase